MINIYLPRNIWSHIFIDDAWNVDTQELNNSKAYLIAIHVVFSFKC